MIDLSDKSAMHRDLFGQYPHLQLHVRHDRVIGLPDHVLVRYRNVDLIPLDIGRVLPVPIIDLEIHDERGISGGFSFSRELSFLRIPWSAVAITMTPHGVISWPIVETVVEEKPMPSVDELLENGREACKIARRARRRLERDAPHLKVVK